MSSGDEVSKSVLASEGFFTFFDFQLTLFIFPHFICTVLLVLYHLTCILYRIYLKLCLYTDIHVHLPLDDLKGG